MSEKQDDKKKLSKAEIEKLHNMYDESIQKFTLMSDTFMSIVFSDKECAEEMLSVILGKRIRIVEIKTQYNIQNIRGRSARLDIKAIDDEGKVINVEVQNSSEGALPERARFNSSLMDTELLEKGDDFSKLPTTFVIIITKTDVLKGNKPIYHIDRTIKELGNKDFNDRSRIIYVNGKIQDEATALGRLMHDMNCKNAKDMYNKKLADRVDYFKNKERGEHEMCEIMEEIATERENKAIIESNLRFIKIAVFKYNKTAEEAMSDLQIDRNDYSTYYKMLGIEK